jgi:hypothetical protein
MIRLIIIFSLTLSYLIAQSQSSKFSIDLGGGYTNAESFPGINIDGQFTYNYKRWHIGSVLQIMSTYEQVNSPENVLYIFEAIPEGVNAFGYSYTSNWQRSQAHFGLLAGFDVIQSTRLRLNLSIGYGYSRYRELRFVENYVDSRWQHLTFISKNTQRFDFNYGLSMSYDVYKTLFVGTRMRYVTGITDALSFNFMVGIRI